MIRVQVPGYKQLNLKYLVMDYNGTLAIDGKLIARVDEWFRRLSDQLELHVLTADTFGLVREQMSHLPCTITVLSGGNQSEQKAAYVEKLGGSQTATIGNGRNDRLMLQTSDLGIATIQREGASAETLATADIVVFDVLHAFELLANPKRLMATLRDE